MPLEIPGNSIRLSYDDKAMLECPFCHRSFAVLMKKSDQQGKIHTLCPYCRSEIEVSDIDKNTKVRR